MDLLKCSRCGFIAAFCSQDLAKPCPICRGRFLPLDEDEEIQYLKFLKTIQALRESPFR
ncbi:hypothetical protein ES703_48185 [subsurface metagenome]